MDVVYGSGLQCYGDSFTVGYNATSNSGYVNRIRTLIGGSFSNFGVGSTGVQLSAQNGYANHPAGSRTVANTWMCGLNDVRGRGADCFDLIEQGLTAFLTSAFLGNYKCASQMTKTGSWSSLTNNYGGKSFALGGTPLFIGGTLSASLSWQFTGNNVAIGAYSTNGTVGHYYDFDIDIDGEHFSFPIFGKTGAIAGAAAKLITGLPDGNHTVTIKPLSTLPYTTIDFVSTVTGVNKAPVFVSEIPKISDWSQYGSIGSQAMADEANVIIRRVVDDFKSIGCNVCLVKVNDFYDPSGSSDGIHPNDRGHSQIAQAFLSNMRII